MLKMLHRLKHKFTGHKEEYLDRRRTYDVWGGEFVTGMSEYTIPIQDQWHIKCSCGKCMRHHLDESETTVEADSLGEVWAKLGGGPYELMRSHGFPDVSHPKAQGISQGFMLDLDKLDKLGVELPEELQN